LKNFFLIFILILSLAPMYCHSQLIWCTLLGSNGTDLVCGSKVDDKGEPFVTGITNYSNFPTTTGAYDTKFINNSSIWMIFVTKFNSDATNLVFSTFLNGMGYAYYTNSLAIDSEGNSYITGYGTSQYPTTKGAYDTDTNFHLSKAIITKLNSTGTALIYSTFLGGHNRDYGYGIVVDTFNEVYLTGITSSNDFPTTTGAYNIIYNNADAFVSKLNRTSDSLLYSTFLGGQSGDIATDIVLDNLGNAYITGYTGSQDFPTTNLAYDKIFHGKADNFITKLNSAGTALIYSTLIGGSTTDNSYSIAIDKYYNAYITGRTTSIDYPATPNAYDSTCTGCSDGGVISYAIFVTKLNSTGTALVYSTFIDHSYSIGIVVDSNCNAYITGAGLKDYPVTCDAYAYNNTVSCGSCVITELNEKGSDILYSTFLGGCGNYGQFINFDKSNNIYIIGINGSGKLPITHGVYDSIYHKNIDSIKTGQWDIFISKLQISNIPIDVQSIKDVKFNSNSCSVLQSRDTTISIKNNSEYVLRFYNSKLNGTDSNYFQVIFPDSMSFCISPHDSIELIIKYFPDSTSRDKKAKISIDNNSSSNPYIINLTGHKDSINISPINDTLNLGDIYLNNIKDTTFQIKNYGTTKTGGYIKIPAKFSSDISSFVMDSSTSIAIPLHFKGDSTLGAIVDSVAIIDSICGFISYIYLFANIINIPATATLQTPISAGCPGDTVEMPIYLINQKFITESGTSSFEADLKFNASLLVPLDEPRGTVTDGIRTVHLNMPLSEKNNDTLTGIKFIVGLGNDTITPLTFTNVVSIGGKVNIDTINGFFKLECVCHEGGARLINIESTLSLTCKPNPANDKVQFDFETIEDGHTELFISDMLGNKLMKVFESDIHGKYSIEADLSLFYVGVYAFTLQTPTARVSKLFIIDN
jgi:hypothetical protein